MSAPADHSCIVPPLSPLRKAWRLLRLLGRPASARKLGTLATDGYLVETGWMRSIERGGIVDGHAQPIPWVTYPFLDFLGPRLHADWSVFEYGAGASTLYFARRVRAVIAVEHDEAFAATLRPQLPAHVELRVRAAGSPGYAAALTAGDGVPSLVIVDGVDREACLRHAARAMPAQAVLVLDDAERAEYAPAIAWLREQGFRRIEFWGLAPGVVRRKCTAVYYRPNNVLGL